LLDLDDLLRIVQPTDFGFFQGLKAGRLAFLRQPSSFQASRDRAEPFRGLHMSARVVFEEERVGV
jgi:hypothetical protein